MYTYSQGKHTLSKDGVLQNDTGHSGNGAGLNNPAMQEVHDTGPLPRGMYTIGEWQAEHGQLGPVVAPLIPDAANEMFGRWIVLRPRTGSE